MRRSAGCPPDAGSGWDDVALTDPDGHSWLVAVDVSSARSRPTGVGVYIRDLAQGLVRTDPDAIALIGVRPDGPLAETAPRAAAAGWHAGGHHHRWLMTAAASDARRVHARIAHFTNASAPMRAGLPYVLTIQDLSVIRYPLYHPPLRVATIPIVWASAQRATAIIVPSQATRAELRRLLGVAARKVVVIPHAASADIPLRNEDGADPGLAKAVRRQVGVGSDPFILSIGTIEPRKNQVRLVRAFEALAREHPALRLVLVGAPGWRGDSLIHAIQSGPGRDRIHLAGYLAPEALAALLGDAEVFAYVSLYEGFGLPILEAMARGVPVVTSAVSSMPEVAADAAILVDPRDVTAIEAGLRAAVARRSQLSAAGLKRARWRDWGDVAGETLEVYRWSARQAG